VLIGHLLVHKIATSAQARSRYTFVNRPICQHLSIDYVSLVGRDNAAKPALYPVRNSKNPSRRRKQLAGPEQHPGDPADLPISQRDSENRRGGTWTNRWGICSTSDPFRMIRIRCVTPAGLGKLCDAAGR
jgi:hypothetical protein